MVELKNKIIGKKKYNHFYIQERRQEIFRKL